MAKKHGNVKDSDRYEAMREEGMSKEKAARIANTPEKKAGRRGGKAGDYEDWTKEELYDKAKDVGIEGRSHMSKNDLIHSLRSH
jgi:Rho termination factor, N-terminal domain